MSKTQLIFGFLLLSASSPFLQAVEIQFNRDVRPILADKCYACHGPDADQRQADLRLDIEAEAKRDLGGYAAVVAGSSSESLLVDRILATDPDEQMPPTSHPKQLTEGEKEILIEWIDQGAGWQQHWAYVPPHRVQPQVTSHWTRNYIDRFVLQKLQSERLSPSQEADPRILIRRLYFDLVGLPPTLEEVSDFEADHSDEAYELLVDRLLRSPHFGERLAMYWLDLVRYADTVGYHGDQDVSISPYRDYVIHAFNENMPFDQFTREQLAGDLLENPTLSQMVASGYNRLGMMSAEGGVQPEEYLAKYAADRVRNASTVWLGSTMGCAECHDHKYDPFTTKDFYQFASFFADIKERGLYSGANRDGQWGPMTDVPDRELAKLLEPLTAAITEVRKRYEARTPELERAQEIWEGQQMQSLSQWTVLHPSEANARHGTDLKILENGAILASGKSPAQNTYEVLVTLNSNQTGLRIEVLPDSTLPQDGPGRAGNGNFVITEVEVHSLANSEHESVALRNALATHEQADGNKKNPYSGWKAAATIDGERKGATWGWAILPQVGQSNSLLIEFAVSPAPGEYRVILKQNHDNPKHTLGKFRLLSTNADVSESGFGGDLLSALSDQERLALSTPRSNRSTALEKAAHEAFRRFAPELESVRQELAGLEKKTAELKTQYTRSTLVTQAVAPREMRVLKRGNWMDTTGEVVSPSVPHFLTQLSVQGRATRLDLANWLVSKDNPLTARVFVNRLWKLYFGTGLSKVLDDVGAQGEAPSHPELLDALAVDFVESHWNIKHIIKQIVLSSSYRQSSLASTEVVNQDPYNRLIARQSRFRLDAELIRDNALAVSGLLVRKVGGRSVKPYQPVGLYRHLNFPTRTYQADSGMNQYRRGLYTHWQRQFLHPAMQAFDAPAREECTAERPRSNTPLAALVLLNDPSYVEAARSFAEKILTESEGTVSDRMDWALRTALSRQPTAQEADVLLRLYQSEVATFRKDPDQADQLLAIGQSKPDRQLDAADLAAWTSVARAIFNMHEMVTRN